VDRIIGEDRDCLHPFYSVGVKSQC
jgi:hypothetical protein